MNGEYAWWFLIVGLCVGAAGVWFVRGSVARDEEDVSAREREVEAAWISRTIEDAGGIAPADLVGQVLALHRAYLREAEPFEIDETAEEPARRGEIAAVERAPVEGHPDATAPVLSERPQSADAKGSRQPDAPRA